MPAEIVSISQTQWRTSHSFRVTTRADDVAAADLVGYRLYRSGLKIPRERYNNQTFAWKSSAETYVHNDRLGVSQGTTYEWVRVRKNASGEFEELIEMESVFAESSYFILHPTSSTSKLDIELKNVNSEDFGDEIESVTINLIGRGRKEDRGDVWGKTGSISAQIRGATVAFGAMDATTQRLTLEAMGRAPTHYFFFTPFGDRYKITMKPPRFDRVAGVGNSEFLDVSIDYAEIVT